MHKHSRELRFSPLAGAISRVFAGVSTLLFVGYASAQPQPTTEEPEEIVVTGSRIQRTSGFATAVPVTAVTRDDLTNIQPGRTMADQLDQLPQFFATQSAQRGGGALFGSAGISTLNLRAMGPQRTLVLVDGVRVAPADRDGSVHIDNIPSALLSQVEVVTGGASAAYGADALAGVVNFRINREFEGLDSNVAAGRTDAGFGDQVDASVAYGTPFGERWHFIGSAENQNIDPIDPDPNEARRLVPALRHRRESGVGERSKQQRRNRNGSCCPTSTRRLHTPTGRVGAAANAAGGAAPLLLGGAPSVGLNFNLRR